MNKKGSILLSLLTVILLLGIILFFMFGNNKDEKNDVNFEDTIESSVGGANASSIYAYINSVEFEIAKSFLYDTQFVSGKYSIFQIDEMYTLLLRSDKPSEGNMCISSNGVITKGIFKLNNYVFSYDGNNVKTMQSTSIEDIDCLEI